MAQQSTAENNTYAQDEVQIAIVVPLYKHSGLVWEALSTALDQDDADRYGIVLVNDGCPFSSTHSTGLSFANANTHVPIRYVRQKNKGLSGARNTGIAHAYEVFPNFDAIYFLDADNRLTRHSIRNMLQALERHPEAHWFYPDIQTFGLGEHFSMAGQYRPRIHAELNICEAGSLVRREIFDAGIRFDEDMKSGYEDWEFWLAAVSSGFRNPKHLPSIEYRYRRRPESMLSSSHREDGAIRNYMAKKHPWLMSPEHLDPKNSNYDDPESPLAVITPSGGGYFSTLTHEFKPIPIKQIRDDFWRWRLKPTAYGFPGHILFADRDVLETLHGLKILDWVVWDLRNRLKHGCHITSVELKSDEQAAIALILPHRLQPSDAPLSPAMSLIETNLFAATVAETYPTWLSQILQTNNGPIQELRQIRVPANELESVGAFTNSSQQLLSTAMLFHNAELEADLHGWQALSAGVPIRNGKSRSFLQEEAENEPSLYPSQSERPQIAFTMPFADFGGVERVAYQIARVMAAEGFDCHLVCLSNNPVKTPLEFREAFKSISWFPSERFLSWSQGPYLGTFLPTKLPPSEERQLISLLSSFDVVINCQSPDLRNILGKLKQAGVYCIDHQHIVEKTKTGQPVGHPYQGLAFEHSVDLFLTCSNQLRDWFISNGVPSEKVLPVVNGPGLIFSDDDLKLKAKQLEGSKFEADRPLRAVFLGRLEYQKGVDRLVDLIRETSETIDWRVIGKAIVGDDLSTGLSALGVDIEEPLYDSHDIRAVFDWADIMVLPSRFEGLPLVIIDAMSCGVPVITTNVGAVEEVVQNGENGYVLSEDEFVHGATELLDSLSEDRAKLLKTAKKALGDAMGYNWSERSKALVETLKGKLLDG